jgi:hypothetical protein
MLKALPLALAAALLASAGTASAQSAGDIRCIVVSNAFASQATDSNEKKVAESALYFYLGRVGDGLTPARLKSLLDTETKGLSEKTAGAEMDKCVAAIQAKIKMMQDLAQPPAAAQKPEGR